MTNNFITNAPVTDTLIIVFSNILIMSLQAAIAAAIVMLIKKMFAKKMNIRIGYILWIMVLLRFALPILPASPISVFNYININNLDLSGKVSEWISVDTDKHSTDIQSLFTSSAGTSKSDAKNGQENEHSSQENEHSPIDKTNNIRNSTELPYTLEIGNNRQVDSTSPSHKIPKSTTYIPIFNKLSTHGILLVLAFIWIIGAISTFTYLIATNVIFALRLRAMPHITLSDSFAKLVEKIRLITKVHRPIKFVESEDIISPCVFGIIKCTIILPKGLLDNLDNSNPNAENFNKKTISCFNFTRNNISHMLTHEFAHIKRNDLIVCWLSSLICAIHWFNPLAWYYLIQIKKEQDLCADAYTMSLIEEKYFTEYGQTLLLIAKNSKCTSSSLVSKSSPALISAGITENRNTLKERIMNIAAFTKNKYRFTFIGILIIFIAGIFLCTSQVGSPRTAKERMKFDDNIIMSVTSNAPDSPGNINLQIINNNDITIHSCQLEIYTDNPNKPGAQLVYNAKNFNVPGKKYKNFDIDLNIGNSDINDSNLDNSNKVQLDINDFDSNDTIINSNNSIINDNDLQNAYLKFSYKVGFAFNNKSNEMWRSGNLTAFDKTLIINNWGAVSDEEINSFIKENNINAVAINRIYNFYTIIMFENGGWQGYYELYKDTKLNKLRSRKITGYGPTDSDNPVLRFGGTASGNFPFINFIINSPVLLALGDKIELQTSAGTIAGHVSGKAFHTMETRGFGNVNKILIYNKDNELIFDGEKILLKDVYFKPDDPSHQKIIEEKGYKIINQSPITYEIYFTSGMFPENYVIAYQSDDMDWKIPLFTYENTTVYLKSIVESNESPDYLYANFYFVHEIDKSPGIILSSTYINFRDNSPHSYTSNVYPERNVFSSAMNTVFEDAVSLRSSGPGDQIAIYLDRSMVEKTNGVFTVTLEGLNRIDYVPESQYKGFNEQKKKQIRDMVYNELIGSKDAAKSKDKLTGVEEVYAAVGNKGQKVIDLNTKKFIDVSGKYVYYVSFHTELDGLLGPITAFVDPKTEKIIGVVPRY